MMKQLLILLSFVLANIVAAQTTLIKNVTIHHGNGKVTQNGAVTIKEGYIQFAGLESEISQQEFDETIDGKGQHLYPGFIAPNSTVGLQEIGAVRASRDQYEIGAFTPHVRSLIAYNTDSKISPTLTYNGVLTIQVTPRGGWITGSSSVVSLDARNWEEAAIAMDNGIHLNWPTYYYKTGWWANPGGWKKNDKYSEQVENIRGYFEKTFAYTQTEQKTKDLQYEAMKGLFNGDRTLYVNVDDARSILQMVQLKKDFDIPKVVVIGGYYADRVAGELVNNQISVLLQRVHETPTGDDDAIDKPFTLAKTLKDKGVLVGLQNTGDMEQMNTRNLPFLAGTLTAYGFTDEEALSTITWNNAKILGVDDVLGVIEEGKQATLFISKGNPLEMKENNITIAMIQGVKIDPMKNHQLRLYREYKDRFKTIE